MLRPALVLTAVAIALCGCQPDPRPEPVRANDVASSAGDEPAAQQPEPARPFDGRDLIETPEQHYARVFGTCPYRDPKLAAMLDATRPLNLGSPAPMPSSIDLTPADAGAIRATIVSNLGDLEDCYVRALEIWPTLGGHIALRFAISSADGSVVDARVESNDTGNEALACCTARKPYAWTFPTAGGKGFTVVTYPFMFDAR
jgi:hypothetical protein